MSVEHVGRHVRPAAVDQPLFAVDGATEGTLQWKAETFQMVNWGGFEGQVSFNFHPGATLISGASGSGKSTLLDAYIALMMPADTPFNGASNDAVSGRVRGDQQRNLLSYLRGQVDTTADEVGRMKPKVLRGEGRPTWGAVAMTFIDDHAHRYTALRVYYVPARATTTGEITMRMATYEGALNLADLGQVADQLFTPKALKAAFPGMSTHDSYSAFATRLHTRLGIGANGDGAKALRLLVRIQSGHQIRTVDELYKEMVLERPATFAAADRALEHFDDLEAAYLAMTTEQQKAELLAPITARHQSLTGAAATIETIDTFGLTRPGPTPIQLWSLRTEAKLLDAAAATNGDERARTSDGLRSARRTEQDKTTDVEEARAQHLAGGGAQLETLSARIDQARDQHDARATRLDELTAKTLVLGTAPDTAERFAQLRAESARFLADYRTRETALIADGEAALKAQFPLQQRRTELHDERASLQGRAGRVPKYLDDVRRALAAAAGMAADELPFVAELIDVAPEHTRWRGAIETVLAGTARTLLVPRDDLRAFSAAIDQVQVRPRVSFEGVPVGDHDSGGRDPARIAGKLLIKASPFRGWIAAHISEEARNALCVETAAELNGPGYRVTLAGQTRRGARGTHGRNDSPNIIGFSNEESLAAIDAELADLEHQLTQLDTSRRAIEASRAELDRKSRAYEAIQATRFDDIDVAGTLAKISDLEAAREKILTGDDRLQALQAHLDDMLGQLEVARRNRFALQEREHQLSAEHADIVDRQDLVADSLEQIEHAGVLLDDAQAAALDEHFAAAVTPEDPESLPAFAANLARLRARLVAHVDAARTEQVRAEGDLERIFAAYQLKWEDPNLGRSAASYPDYAAILDDILTTGLYDRRQEWRTRLMKWSGEDLVPLSGAMESCVAEIEERLEPINDILRGLAFGAGRDRLQIKLRRLAPENVTAFRRELRTLSSAATKTITEEQMEAKFRELQKFMARIRKRDDPRAVVDLADRDRLLDVRRHVEIAAERFSPDGRLLSTHSSLGGKSGGESQELIAFIVGAALRFRLGDEERTRPRFAPVFLDEGFIKSDAEFAGRAVQAWKGLGFQLIVGAPLDKVMALEPHMDEMMSITKSSATNRSHVRRISDADRVAARAGV